MPKPATFDPLFWLTDAHQHHHALITGVGGHRRKGAVLPARVTFVVETLAIMLALAAGSSAAAQDSVAEADREAIEREQFDEPTVLGLIPKRIFETGILYEVGPTFAKDLALAHDGSGYGEPLTVRDWRQTVFELDRNKLHYDALPDYINYIERAEEYRWDHAADNREVILIGDVEFEWLPDGLEANPGLRRDSAGNYRLNDSLASGLLIGKHRYFGAALVNPVLHDRLITFALGDDFVYSNREDPISDIDIQIDGRSFSIPIDGTQRVDLGDAEGKKIVHLAANHESGTSSYASFQFDLERLPSGHWANTTERADVTEESASRAANADAGGVVDFTIRHLPPVVFTTDPNVD